MRTTRFVFLVVAALAMQSLVVRSTPGQGLFRMDFGELENLDEIDGWDVFPTFSFFDCVDLDFACIDTDEETFGTWRVTDWSNGGDDDVNTDHDGSAGTGG